MKKKGMLIVCSVLVSVAAFAQGFGERGQNDHRGRGFGGPDSRRGAMMMPMRDNRGGAEEELRGKFPEEMAALEKERADVEAKMQALAEKAGVKLPEADFVLRKKMADFRKKYEKELNEISDLRKTDPRAAMQKMSELMQKEGLSMGGMGGMGGMRGGMMRPDDNGGPGPSPAGRADMRRQMEEKVKSVYPEEYAEYEKLRSTDPHAADRKLRELLRRNNTEKAGK